MVKHLFSALPGAAILGCLLSPACQGGDLSPFLSSVGTSTLDRAVQDPGGAIEVSASTNSSNATIELGRTISQTTKGDVGVFSSIAITGAAPLNKTDSTTDIATLDGLVNAATISGKYTWFQVTGKRNPANDPKLTAICDEMTAAYRQQTKKTDTPDCDSNAVKQYLPKRFGEFQSLFWDPDGSKFAAGITPRLGYQTFKYLDPATVASKTVSRSPWSLEVFGSLSPANWRLLLTLGGQYQRAFKDASAGALCPASAAGATISCKTGPVGKPSSSDVELLYIEARKLLGFAGLSLKASYDFKAKIAGFDLPISLLRNSSGGLSGGVRIGWTQDHHWQAGVFAGNSFQLF